MDRGAFCEQASWDMNCNRISLDYLVSSGTKLLKTRIWDMRIIEFENCLGTERSQSPVHLIIQTETWISPLTLPSLSPSHANHPHSQACWLFPQNSIHLPSSLVSHGSSVNWVAHHVFRITIIFLCPKTNEESVSPLITLNGNILDLNFREEFIQVFHVLMKKMAKFGLYWNSHVDWLLIKWIHRMTS